MIYDLISWYPKYKINSLSCCAEKRCLIKKLPFLKFTFYQRTGRLFCQCKWHHKTFKKQDWNWGYIWEGPKCIRTLGASLFGPIVTTWEAFKPTSRGRVQAQPILEPTLFVSLASSHLPWTLSPTRQHRSRRRWERRRRRQRIGNWGS